MRLYVGEESARQAPVSFGIEVRIVLPAHFRVGSIRDRMQGYDFGSSLPDAGDIDLREVVGKSREDECRVSPPGLLEELENESRRQAAGKIVALVRELRAVLGYRVCQLIEPAEQRGIGAKCDGDQREQRGVIEQGHLGMTGEAVRCRIGANDLE